MNYLIKNLRVPTSKRVRTEDGLGWKSIPDGHLTAAVNVELNERFILAVLAPRAIRAKGKRARSGPVLVKALNVRHEPEATK